MKVNARTEEFEHLELFDKPALFTNGRIDRSTVPDGWYAYDFRGSDDDPGELYVIEEKPVVVNHSGTALMPEKLEFPSSGRLHVEDELGFVGDVATLEKFCQMHGIEYPAQKFKYEIKPASPDEAGLFFAMASEKDAELGCIGHVRMDFGKRGTEFWHTWWPRGPAELNSPEFKAELQEVVDEMRQSVLKDYASMERFCYGHGGKIQGGWVQNYGYTVDTENYRYCLRCNPVRGDYNAYLTCFDKRVQQMNMAEEVDIHQNIRDWYIKAFPTDELGPQIKDITFSDLVDSMNCGEDVYKTLGVNDSIVRERIFDRIATTLEVDYEVIYQKWLYGNKAADIELPGQPGQQTMQMGGM